jgi:two-component system response regulator
MNYPTTENTGHEILLVEDNPHEARLTIMSLQEHNLAENLVHIDDGAEALDFIFARGIYTDRGTKGNPKIILLDLNLPKIGGLEVLKQIKANEKTKSIPVVILSSSKEDADVITGYELGVNSYIVKPVDFEAFSKAVSDLGSYWMLLNESAAVMLLAKSKIADGIN